MPEVLLVMRTPGNAKVLGEALAGVGYDVLDARDAAELQALLDGGSRPAAALVDVTGYREEIWAMCAALQRGKVPFLVVSSPLQRDFGSRGLAFGAASVLTKPLVKSSLLRLLTELTGREPEPAGELS